MADEKNISRPPTRWETLSNKLFRRFSYLVAWSTVAVVALIVFVIARGAMPAMRSQGMHFLTGKTWDTNAAKADFSDFLDRAGKGDKSAVETLHKLGLDPDKLAPKGAGDQLGAQDKAFSEVAVALTTVQDAAERNELAKQIYGRRGPDIVQLAIKPTTGYDRKQATEYEQKFVKQVGSGDEDAVGVAKKLKLDPDEASKTTADVLFPRLAKAIRAYRLKREQAALAKKVYGPEGPEVVEELTQLPNVSVAAGEYGILPAIWGTMYSSVLAVIFGGLFGLAVAIFLSERFLSTFAFSTLKLLNLHLTPIGMRLPNMLETTVKSLVELLAAIPSVVYGLWGIYVLIPFIDARFENLHQLFPSFPEITITKSMLPASIVLAIMILPTVSAISRDALVSVPPKLREAAYGLGATRWETIFGVILPTARIGIVGSVLLGFGRAIGETMALAMLVGNQNFISLSLFSPAYTLAALLADKFKEPGGEMDSVLMYAALVLLALTLAVNVLGALVLQQSGTRLRGARAK